MVSPLSPMQVGPQQSFDPVGSYLSGKLGAQKVQLNDQAIQQNQQQFTQADFEHHMQRLQVANQIFTKAKELPTIEQRAAFMNSLNDNMLKSVGADKQTLSQTGLDDTSLDAAIAQTGNALHAHSPFRKESVNTTSGLQVFDPSKGTYTAAVDANGKPLTGAAYDPTLQGQIAGAKQTGQNQSDLGYKPQIATATDTAKAEVEMKTKPGIEAATTAATEKAKIDAINAQSQNVASGKLDDATALYEDLSKADLDKIYGRGESKYPDFARSQKGIDMIAKRNQLIAMLKLGARGELKGQGAVSDTESGMVADAATLLNNPDISPTLAKEALDRAMNVLRRNAGKAPQQGAPAKKLTYDPATGTFH